jgi:hypothetical protein
MAVLTAAPTPGVTDLAWWDWALLDFNNQVGVFNDRAATAAVWAEAGAPTIMPTDTVSPTRPDLLPTTRFRPGSAIV